MRLEGAPRHSSPRSWTRITRPDASRCRWPSCDRRPRVRWPRRLRLSHHRDCLHRLRPPPPPTPAPMRDCIAAGQLRPLRTSSMRHRFRRSHRPSAVRSPWPAARPRRAAGHRRPCGARSSSASSFTRRVICAATAAICSSQVPQAFRLRSSGPVSPHLGLPDSRRSASGAVHCRYGRRHDDSSPVRS